MFTSLTEKHPTSHTKDKKSAFIHYQTAIELGSTIQETSHMYLNH